MTKPRASIHRELFGLLGSFPDSSTRRQWWNRLFKEEGIDAFMDQYGTTPKNIVLRLSEMFTFDRRGYAVAEQLQQEIIPLLDTLDESVTDRVDTIVNNSGVLCGYFVDDDDEERWRLWNT